MRLAAGALRCSGARVVAVTSCEVAEACKILENTYRAVNIALVNELKLVFERMKIDVWEVIEAARTKPFGFQAFYPGPGLGGHCIPIDPFYLTWIARSYGIHTRFIELAGEINTAMPHHVVDRVIAALNDRGRALRASRILVLGAAYKPNVDDCRESPAFELMELLQERGATVPTMTLMSPSSRRYAATDPARKRSPLGRDPCRAGLRADCHRPRSLRLGNDRAHTPLLVDTRGATRRLAPEVRSNIVMA